MFGMNDKKYKDMSKDEKEGLVTMITSIHTQQLGLMIDECTNKNLNFESAKMLKEGIQISFNQICDSFFQAMQKLKEERED